MRIVERVKVSHDCGDDVRVFSVQVKIDDWKLLSPVSDTSKIYYRRRDLLQIYIHSRLPCILTESMLISCTRLRGGKDIGRSHIRPKDQSICSPRPNLISMLLAVSNCGSATYAWMLSRRLLCEAVRAACSPASAFSISLCLEHLKGLLACAPILWNYPKVREFKDTCQNKTVVS